MSLVVRFKSLRLISDPRDIVEAQEFLESFVRNDLMLIDFPALIVRSSKSGARKLEGLTIHIHKQRIKY